LWLLATLSEVTISWGIAPAQGRQSSGQLDWRAVLVSPRGPRVTCEPLLAPTPKDDPPTLERRTLL
jgi:hypothetical protein